MLNEDIKKALNIVPKLDLPKMDMSWAANLAKSIEDIEKNKFNMMNLVDNLPPPTENPLVKIAKEQNESLKSIVNYNEEISTYNRELVRLNEKILSKINSLDDTLIFLNKSFSNKIENDKESDIRNQALLLELITIIDTKDSSKLENFMTTLGAPVAVGLIVEYFKFKLGLS